MKDFNQTMVVNADGTTYSDWLDLSQADVQGIQATLNVTAVVTGTLTVTPQFSYDKVTVYDDTTAAFAVASGVTSETIIFTKNAPFVRFKCVGATITPDTAVLSTNLTGTNNDLDFTAVDGGTAGNRIKICYEDPGVSGATESVAVATDSGITTITFSLATSAVVQSTLSTDLVGDNNDIVFTAVPVGTLGDSVTVAYTDPGAASQSLAITVTGTAIVVSLATNGSSTITSTADEIKAAILAHYQAQYLVTCADKAGNDGSGVVTAMVATALSGGSNGAAITSTGDTIKATLVADATASALVTAADKAGNDGSGTVIAMTATALSGGTDAIAFTLNAVDRSQDLPISDVQIGAVEIKDGDSDVRLDVLTQDAAFGTSTKGLPIFGKYQASPTTYTDGDAAPVLLDANGRVVLSSDIEIGAVELKNGATDDRALISDANTARVVGDHVLSVQEIGADGTVPPTGSLLTNAPFAKITDGTSNLTLGTGITKTVPAELNDGTTAIVFGTGTQKTVPCALSDGTTEVDAIATINSLKTDTSSVAGTATDVNSGDKSNGSQRVVIATDDVNVSAIKTAAELIDDAVYTDGSGTPAKGILVMGTDGTNPQALSVNSDGELKVNLEAADIEIGAVELKNGADDGRAIINDANTVRAVTDDVLLTQSIDAAGAVLSTSALATSANQTNKTQMAQVTDGTNEVDVIATINSLKSDLSSVAGTATDVNSGNKSNGSQRVVIATDDVNTSAISSTLTSINGKLVTGTDIGDVTVNNAAGASAVNIQDGGNVITVDGAVTVSATDLDIRDLTNASDSVAIYGSDDGGTTKRIIKTDAGGAIQVDLEIASVTADTELPAAALLADNTATPTAPAVGAFGMLYDGATWDLARGDATNGALVNLGSNNDVTVTGSVTANAGTNLNTSLLALETGGNLAAAATSLGNLDNAVDGNYLNVNANIAGTDIVGGAGAVAAGVQRVTLASDDPAVTALQVIDNIVSGSEAQVDVVAALPTGTNIIGAVKRDVINYTGVRKYYTNAGAVTDGIVWSPAAGKKWVITDLIINTSAAATVTLEEDLAGGDSAFMKFELAANGGTVINLQTPLASTEDDADLIVTTSAGNIYITASGYEID